VAIHDSNSIVVDPASFRKRENNNEKHEGAQPETNRIRDWNTMWDGSHTDESISMACTQLLVALMRKLLQ
jgi:hypothetical protein